MLLFALMWFALLLMPLPGEIVGQSCMFYGAGVGLRRFSISIKYYTTGEMYTSTACWKMIGGNYEKDCGTDLQSIL